MRIHNILRGNTSVTDGIHVVAWLHHILNRCDSAAERAYDMEDTESDMDIPGI